jgi:hypothetical protein
VYLALAENRLAEAERLASEGGPGGVGELEGILLAARLNLDIAIGIAQELRGPEAIALLTDCSGVLARERSLLEGLLAVSPPALQPRVTSALAEVRQSEVVVGQALRQRQEENIAPSGLQAQSATQTPAAIPSATSIPAAVSSPELATSTSTSNRSPGAQATAVVLQQSGPEATVAAVRRGALGVRAAAPDATDDGLPATPQPTETANVKTPVPSPSPTDEASPTATPEQTGQQPVSQNMQP